jgi:flagellar motor switch protein FliG
MQMELTLRTRGRRIEIIEPRVFRPFKFTDLLYLSHRSQERLLRELELERLALALQGANETMIDCVLARMSPRIGKHLLQEMDKLKGAHPILVERARRYVVETAQRLDAVGQIMIPSPNDDVLLD